jgi:hypothetical protein
LESVFLTFTELLRFSFRFCHQIPVALV